MVPQRRHRTNLSLVMLALQLVATGIHVVPALVYPATGVRTTTRIVAEISSLGPVWVLTFGASSLVLGLTLWLKRGQAYGHLAAAAVWVMYATGLWLGTFANHPHGTVFFPTVATVITIVHVITAASYNEDAEGGTSP
jgi:hypothetical protein